MTTAVLDQLYASIPLRFCALTYVTSLRRLTAAASTDAARGPRNPTRDLLEGLDEHLKRDIGYPRFLRAV